MSFANMFGSPGPSSPSVLGLQTDSPAGSSSFGSPRKNMIRKKRKQAKLVNPARSFDFSVDNNNQNNSAFGGPGFGSFNDSGFDFGGQFLAELSPQASPALSLVASPQPSGSVTIPKARAENASAFPAATTIQIRKASFTTPDVTPERERGSSSFEVSAPRGQENGTPRSKADRLSTSPSSFAADGSFLPPSASTKGILSPIENTMPPIRSPTSPIAKLYTQRSFSPLGKGSPLARTSSLPLLPKSPTAYDLSDHTPRIFSRGSDGNTDDDVSHVTWREPNDTLLAVTPPPQKQMALNGSTPDRFGPYENPPTPGTPDSEREVEGLTQSLATFDMGDESSYEEDSFGHNATPDRSATIGPSPGRNLANMSPEVPSTPAPSRFSAFEFTTPARTSSIMAQTPRSILRPLNTPATGNSVRFNSIAYYKVIERLPEFNASVTSPQESLGDEGTTPLGMEPIEKFEVPMLEPSSSDEELDFQPTHHNNTLDSVDSDGFDEEVERNTLANSQTVTDPLNATEDGTGHYLTDNSLEATTQWLVDFVSEKNMLQVKGERSVSDSTQRTVSSSSLSPLDAEEPIRHTSPLNPPCEDEGDISHIENLNNSSEWIVPQDLTGFGNDSLPRLEGASFSIAGMVDPDATGATARGITPRRPHGLPAWAGAEIPTISRTASSPTKDDDMTPVAPIRTRLAASKYVSTTPLKNQSASPSGSPRLGTSPKTSPPLPFGSAIRRNSIEDKENRVPLLAISSPVPSPSKASPTLPSVSEDEEEQPDHSSLEIQSKPKQPVFGSLTRSRPSLPLSLRRVRSVFEDDDVSDRNEISSPSKSPKPMLEGKAVVAEGKTVAMLEHQSVAVLTSNISTLSLVEMSGNASKLSFLDESILPPRSPPVTAAPVINPESTKTTARVFSRAIAPLNPKPKGPNATAELLGTHASAVFGAQEEYAKSLEQQVAGLQAVLARCQTDLADSEALLDKLLPLRDDALKMQEQLKSTRRENKDLRAQITIAESDKASLQDKADAAAGLESRVQEVECELDELKARLADAEHANEELQSEVDTLHASQPSRNYKDESGELAERLSLAEDELTFARSQLEQSAHAAAVAQEQLKATEAEQQSAREEAEQLRTDLAAAREQNKHLAVELDAARSAPTADPEMDAKLVAAAQEIDEFKAELSYVRSNTDDLKAALAEAHAEADSLRAQLTDAKQAAEDSAAGLRERETDTALEEELADAREAADVLKVDLESALGEVDHFRAEADAEARERAGVERKVRALEEQQKRSEKALADATAEVKRLEEALACEREMPRAPTTAPVDNSSKDKDRRIKLLEQKVRKLADEREMMNVAVNSAQIETEFFKRRVATLENASSKPKLRAGGTAAKANGTATTTSTATTAPSTAPRRVPT